MEWMEWIKLLVTLAAVYLGAHVALRRFYREKWWEKRLNAFTTQIEAAYLLHRALKYQHDHSVFKDNPRNISGFINLDDKEFVLLEKQYRHALAELEKFYFLGSLLTSQGSVEAIKNFFDKINGIRPLILDVDQDALKNASLWSESLLTYLVAEARSQLNIEEGERRFWKGFLFK